MGYTTFLESLDFFKMPAFFYFNQKTKKLVKKRIMMKVKNKEKKAKGEKMDDFEEAQNYSVKNRGTVIGFLFTFFGLFTVLAYAIY